MAPQGTRNAALECYPEIAFGGFTRCDGTVSFYSRVHALLRPDDCMLDVGCGRGASMEDSSTYRRGLRIFKGKCRKVLGIDIDPAAATNPSLDEFRLMESHGSRWPVEDASVDLAICDYVLEHLVDPDRFVAEAHRVLRPGGYLCARTPNKRGYVAIAARVIPKRLHLRVLARADPGRKAVDVFPAHYRCNTAGGLAALLRRHGFEACVYRSEAEPSYLQFAPSAYRAGALLHRWLPDYFKGTLLCFARRV